MGLFKPAVLILIGWLLYEQGRIRNEMATFKDAMEEHKEAVIGKINEAIAIIQDPNRDNSEAVELLQAFTQEVRDMDLTPNEEPTP
jgi:hypothetical protein